MKKLIGFSLVWIGTGMIIMLFVSRFLTALALIAFCLITGYKLFMCDC